jgi:hypothetical protein
MADLKLSSGSVSVDINAGLTGVHKITIMSGSQSQVVTQQQLIDIVAPSIKAHLDGLNVPSAPSSAPNSPAV